jgi:hypothetical protein
LIKLGVRLMPLLAGWVAFTFLYMAMPNTRTRLARRPWEDSWRGRPGKWPCSCT